MKKIICFDLEGPLSPQDNAYEVMGLVPKGEKIFEVLSKYDDLLAMEERKNYEPGDTLSLILPFLIYHQISEEDIKEVSSQAKILNGVKETITKLREWDCDPYIISTSYQQHALNIGHQIGLEKEKVFCTSLNLEKVQSEAKEEDFSLVEDVEKDILNNLYPEMENEDKLKKRLDRFYYEEIIDSHIGSLIREVEVMGGARKVKAMEKATGERDLSEIAVVGDSITDYKMLSKVNNNDGLSVVFNGNEYAIPNANIGLATNDMRSILVILETFFFSNQDNGGLRKTFEKIKRWEDKQQDLIDKPDLIPASEETKEILLKIWENPDFIPPYYHYLKNANKEKQQKVLEIHKKARSAVRGEAAKLG